MIKSIGKINVKKKSDWLQSASSCFDDDDDDDDDDNDDDDDDENDEKILLWGKIVKKTKEFRFQLKSMMIIVTIG